jgi:hypothetical protein
VEVARFDELDDSWVQTGGLWTRCVFMGPRNSPGSPVGVAMKADRDLGDFIAGKRSFDTTTLTVVLSGTVMHDGRWMSKGDFYVAPPHDINGDLVFGPEGGVIFMMFDNRSGLIPTFADAGDQANFDRLLRKDVEAVAAGQHEKSVAILPLRDDFTKARAITHRTVDEVAQYRAQTGTEW